MLSPFTNTHTCKYAQHSSPTNTDSTNIALYSLKIKLLLTILIRHSVDGTAQWTYLVKFSETQYLNAVLCVLLEIDKARFVYVSIFQGDILYGAVAIFDSKEEY